MKTNKPKKLGFEIEVPNPPESGQQNGESSKTISTFTSKYNWLIGVAALLGVGSITWQFIKPEKKLSQTTYSFNNAEGKYSINLNNPAEIEPMIKGNLDAPYMQALFKNYQKAQKSFQHSFRTNVAPTTEQETQISESFRERLQSLQNEEAKTLENLQRIEGELLRGNIDISNLNLKEIYEKLYTQNDNGFAKQLLITFIYQLGSIIKKNQELQFELYQHLSKAISEQKLIIPSYKIIGTPKLYGNRVNVEIEVDTDNLPMGTTHFAFTAQLIGSRTSKGVPITTVLQKGLTITRDFKTPAKLRLVLLVEIKTNELNTLTNTGNQSTKPVTTKLILSPGASSELSALDTAHALTLTGLINKLPSDTFPKSGPPSIIPSWTYELTSGK